MGYKFLKFDSFFYLVEMGLKIRINQNDHIDHYIFVYHVDKICFQTNIIYNKQQIPVKLNYLNMYYLHIVCFAKERNSTLHNFHTKLILILTLLRNILIICALSSLIL